MTLLDTPEGKRAVEAAMREYSIDPASATDGERGNWRNNLAAALPFIRKMLAEELRQRSKDVRALTQGNELLVSDSVSYLLAAKFIEEGK